uniref:SH2 domain-containing protein n=1 Tax=Clastoptera arizonana TaxID=38151 RepID=A0A1B6CI19_9HEMI
MGKSSSKLKKKDRSQSIAWSFRFPSLISLSRRKMPVTGPHLDVPQWLTILDLTQYAHLFEKFNGVEDLLRFTEADIKDLGIKNASHRARMVSSLVALRAKYDKGNRRKDKPQRHSVAVDTGRLVNQNGTSDILVVSNVLQSKSLCNIRMEAIPDPTADPVQLKKALEWELSLDSRDLRSHAWYHGAIPRTRAEEIVLENGDFLVRDCTSQPGNYVLSCRSKGQGLHFVINKVVIHPDTVYERVQYQFEDDAYDTVPDLITYYVGSGKPISIASNAKIQTPKNRMYPLSFYATKYGLQQQISSGGMQVVSPLASPMSSASGTLRLNTYNNYRSPVHSPPRTKREIPPRLPSKKQRSLSLASETNGKGSLSLPQRGSSVDDRSSSPDGIILDPTMTKSCQETTSANGSKFSTHSLPRGAGINSHKLPFINSSGTATVPRNLKILRVTSDPALSPCVERRRFEFNDEKQEVEDTDTSVDPPPKPSRIPSLLRTTSKDSTIVDSEFSVNDSRPDSCTLSDNPQYPINHHTTFQRVVSYHASGSDSGNGSGDSAQSSAAGDASESTMPCSTLPPHRPSGVVIKNPRYIHTMLHSQGLSTSCSSTTLKAFDYDSTVEDSILMLSTANLELPSLFDLDNFQTLLLPTLENKPLDATALQGVRVMLQETGSRIIANHLTRMDLELTIGTNHNWDGDLGLRISSGIELITLPVGHQIRKDLIERTQCIKLLVAVTILTSSTDSERAEMLNKWIQVAVDTKTALGNLFGFSSVMMGLCMPQIQRLTSTWHILRQKFTDSAFNFEAKLRPTLKNMNECANPQAPNTTIPHLIPFVLLQERTLEDILGTNTTTISTLETSCLSSWESSTSDFGLSTLFAHLETARKFGESINSFRRNSEIVLGDSKVDELLLDMFRTEFHLKFLWGSRGAVVSAPERHSKFEQVLTVMSEKCELPMESFADPANNQNYCPAIGTSV